jgi:hypothetical protein
MAVAGAIWSPERAWPNLLLDGFYVVSLAVSAMIFFASQRLTNARWSAGLRRIPEAFMLLMPVAAVLMLALYFGRQWLYPWSRTGAFASLPQFAGRIYYFRGPAVLGRAVAIFGAWIVFVLLLRRTSLQQDRHPDASLLYHHRLNRYSIAFTLVFALSFTLGSFDWVLSTESSWFTTMYAVYMLSGAFVQGIAAIALAAILLRRQPALRTIVDKDTLHDLGRLMFAFSTFWAYIWTCQFLLIWYSNIPEEVTYYVTRTSGGWLTPFFVSFTANWVVPFFVLLSARAKRSFRVVLVISIWLLVGHWLDLYLLIMPSFWPVPQFGPMEITIGAGYMALAYLLFLKNLNAASLVPLSDPVLAAEELQPHHA